MCGFKRRKGHNHLINEEKTRHNDLDESQNSVPGRAHCYLRSSKQKADQLKMFCDINRLIITCNLQPLTRGESSVDSRSSGKTRTLKTRGRTTNSILRKATNGRCGQCIFSNCGSKCTNFFFFLLFPSGAVLTHDINLHCYTHQC